MHKAVISNRIYLRPRDEAHKKELCKELTHKIAQKFVRRTGPKGAPISNVEIIRNYKMLPQGLMSIPQGRTDLIPEDYEIVDKRVIVDDYIPEPRHALRDSQEPVYASVDGSCIVNALVGWGKTFTALWLAYKFQQKTLIITHTTALRDQWIKEVESLYGFTPGIVGSGKYDLDAPIVVGNVQTLTKYKTELSREFGMVILDEAHHCPATTFSEILDSSYAKYRIGLSGTLERKDGKHIVFRDYFGSVVHRPPQSHTLNPTIKLVHTDVRLHGDNWAQKINALLYDEDYQKFIAALTKVQVDRGHKVLLVAERVEFLKNVKDLLGSSCILVTGETPFEERQTLLRQIQTGEATSIAGSRQIFTEGISVNELSCVILASPTSNPILLEQLIGRIMRLHEDKLDPIVLDIQFASYAERNQNEIRKAFYMSKGWKVI